MNKNIIMNEIKKNINKPIKIKYKLGRNKYDIYEGIIKEVYNNVFIIKTIPLGECKSFTYIDVIIKTIAIEYVK